MALYFSYFLCGVSQAKRAKQPKLPKRGQTGENQAKVISLAD
jgi:hypothetical protein